METETRLAGHLIEGDRFFINREVWKVLSKDPIPYSYEVGLTVVNDEQQEIHFIASMNMYVEVLV